LSVAAPDAASHLGTNTEADVYADAVPDGGTHLDAYAEADVHADGVPDAGTHLDANTETDAGPDALRSVLSAHSPADAVSDGDADDAPNACSDRDV
jgi:hypothetical protein